MSLVSPGSVAPADACNNQPLTQTTSFMQALRIWHAAIASLRSSIAQNACTAVTAAECSITALDAVVAQYGSHPLAQTSELDRLLLSFDEEDADRPQQSPAESPEQASSACCSVARKQHSQPRPVHLPTMSAMPELQQSRCAGAGFLVEYI